MYASELILPLRYARKGKRNRFPAAASSFEDGSTGGWTNGGNTTLANDATQAWHGTKSLKCTAIANGSIVPTYDLSAITANAQYTISAKFKGTVGRWYRLNLVGNVSGTTAGTYVIADGTWQTIFCIKTFAGDAVRSCWIQTSNTPLAGEVQYFDAFQIEAGAVVTAFKV